MKLLILKIGNNQFGLPIGLIREVIEGAQYTPVERAEDDILGLMNLRGQIVTLISPANSLGIDELDTNHRKSAIILKRNSDLNQTQKSEGNQNGVAKDLYAFEVDGVADVIDLETELEPIPGNTPENESKFLSGIARIQNQLFPVLNVAQLIHHTSSEEESSDE